MSTALARMGDSPRRIEFEIGLSFALDPPPEQPTAPTAASTTRTTAPAAQLPAPRHPQFEKTPTTRLMAVARMTALKT
ncbi:Uncharacterised protein [Mycobacteroides abscessus subsp. abscessus]|nr:Uncharacterised protein [Mycobacteroides abscessus subsp. abscessus]